MGGKARIGAAWIALSASMLAGGCYPMEQASLVYSSRQQMGVNVTAGTSDSPGMDVVIGYKGLDVAMVPVAVAKHCKHETPANCVQGNYDMKIIAGRRNESTGTDDLQAAIANLNALISDKSALLRGQQGNLATLQKTISDRGTFYEIENEINRIDALKKSTPADQVEALDGYEKQIGLKRSEQGQFAYAKDENLTELQKTADGLRKNIDSLTTEIGQNKDSLSEKLLAVQMESVGTRDDALSVYGTFDGGSVGNRDGAKLSVGKVFATGIAAQFLSETAGISDCLAKLAILAESVAEGAARSAYVSDTRKLCEMKHAGQAH
ncbi:hypothetical protein [Blastomonas sp. SL216]|uniref:hypothetical protein n=1 Tax=Blastomonas sp. SL216 TaxID=2995169 RepID=UPI00237748C3|nr:hypothetical protein OU999_14960 [Blastomonas sp. SL216]